MQITVYVDDIKGNIMENIQLMSAMIETCKNAILEHKSSKIPDCPVLLRPNHLLWMCGQMLENLSVWKGTKLNRWIGFIQCAMIANGIISLKQAKEMFEKAKNAFDEPSQDLLDHLDPSSYFEFDLGGEG
jgi:hypothetical protein